MEIDGILRREGEVVRVDDNFPDKDIRKVIFGKPKEVKKAKENGKTK